MAKSERSRSSASVRTSAPHQAGASAGRKKQGKANSASEPIVNQRAPEIQKFGTINRMPIGLSEKTARQSVDALNQVLADTMTLRDLYKKHHWQVAGHTFYSLHLLFDKHFEEQATLVDTIAERIQLLGGLAVAMAPDVAEMTKIERPPRGREEVPTQISRVLEAHELILTESRQYAKKASDAGDEGTNDCLISDVVRLNELQAWFVAEHLTD